VDGQDRVGLGFLDGLECQVMLQILVILVGQDGLVGLVFLDTQDGLVGQDKAGLDGLGGLVVVGQVILVGPECLVMLLNLVILDGVDGLVILDGVDGLGKLVLLENLVILGILVIRVGLVGLVNLVGLDRAGLVILDGPECQVMPQSLVIRVGLDGQGYLVGLDGLENRV